MNTLKNNYILLALIVVFCITINAQSIYQPANPDLRRDIYNTGLNTFSNGLGTPQTAYYVGKNSNKRERALYQWNLPNSTIPDNSVINSIRITFIYTPPSGGSVFPSKFFDVGEDLTNPNIDLLWSLTDPQTVTGIGDVNGINSTTFDHTFTGANDPFINAVENSLLMDKFILGVAWRYESPSAGTAEWLVGPTISLIINYTPPSDSVTIDQVLSDGSSHIGALSLWNGTSFGTPFSPPKTFLFDINSTQVIKGDQGIISNEKYNNWNNDPDVTNHHSYTITTGTNNLTSHFNPTYSGITIKNSLEGTSVGGGNIEFQDPWLIDYADPLFGNNIRNQGMTAPFKTRTSPFVPDYTTSFSGDIYKGVFLNQDPALTPTYYSVNVQSPQDIFVGADNRIHKFYFQNWVASPSGSVTFQDANALETPVVFNNSNAVAQANLKGTQLSSQTDAIAGNGQRKIVKTSDGYLHQVYGKSWQSLV